MTDNCNACKDCEEHVDLPQELDEVNKHPDCMHVRF